MVALGAAALMATTAALAGHGNGGPATPGSSPARRGLSSGRRESGSVGRGPCSTSTNGVGPQTNHCAPGPGKSSASIAASMRRLQPVQPGGGSACTCARRAGPPAARASPARRGRARRSGERAETSRCAWTAATWPILVSTTPFRKSSAVRARISGISCPASEGISFLKCGSLAFVAAAGNDAEVEDMARHRRLSDDLIARSQDAIRARLAEIEPLVAEKDRLERALEAHPKAGWC